MWMLKPLDKSLKMIEIVILPQNVSPHITCTLQKEIVNLTMEKNWQTSS